MKSIKKFEKQKMYKEEYILTLNIFYEKYFNKVDNSVLLKEYNLMFDVMMDLVYEHNNTWYINFGKNKYRKTWIYKTNKEQWKLLSFLYRKMWKIEFNIH